MNNQDLIEKLSQARNIIDECLLNISSDGKKTEIFSSVASVQSKQKQTTLREMVKGRKFNNGQEQVAVIVGYHEKISGALVKKDDLKDHWNNAKMTVKYNGAFLNRAKDVFVRVHPDNTCDLTQTGEVFFDKFLQNESPQEASK